MDVKHIIGAVVGAALALGISFLASKGIDVKCPAAPVAAEQPAAVK